MNQDDRPVYDDRLYFTRGRSGWRPEVRTKEKHDFWWGLLGCLAIGCVIGLTVYFTH